MKSRFIMLISAFLIVLCGCQSTEYIMPVLPEFTPVRPQRPVLETVEGEVPHGAVINTVRLMEYARGLEVYSDSWEKFYTQLMEDYEYAGENQDVRQEA